MRAKGSNSDEQEAVEESNNRQELLAHFCREQTDEKTLRN
jgi:hypothetical protein